MKQSISTMCYDLSTNCFIPFILLDKNKKTGAQIRYLFFISLTVDAIWLAPPSFKSEIIDNALNFAAITVKFNYTIYYIDLYS